MGTAKEKKSSNITNIIKHVKILLFITIVRSSGNDDLVEQAFSSRITWVKFVLGVYVLQSL